jgi:hypothetical protein
MNITAIRVHLVRASALLLTLAGIATTADQPMVRAILQPQMNARPRRSLR